MPNQRDVAKHANLSSATVSRYLSDPGSISPGAAERIRAAIDELGYHVDYSAQCLKTGKYNHIGILAPGIGPFYWEVFSWIQWKLNEEGYFSTIFFTRDVNTLSHSYRDMVPPFLKKRQLDGIIFFPLLSKEDDAILENLIAWDRPFVVADRPVRTDGISQVTMDNKAGGRIAAQKFLNLGHKDFLFIRGRQDSSSALERYEGFRGCLLESGIQLKPESILDGDFSAEQTWLRASEKFNTLPYFSAVFASNDSSAIGFMKAATEHGLHCPKDYSIIGYDNNLEFAPYLKPALASFHQPVQEFGTATAAMILSLVKGAAPGGKKLTFQPEFVERESLGARSQ